MTKLIEITTVDDNATVVITILPPTGGGGDGGGENPPPVQIGNPPGYYATIPWPTTGQKRTDIPLSGPAEGYLVTTVPADIVIKPSHVGYCSFAQIPGTTVIGRQLSAWVNGVIAWAGPNNGETEPRVNFTVGNPTGFSSLGAQFNLQPSDVIWFGCSTPGAQPGENVSVYADLATPERY